ncbi:MAG: hypothetical protein IJN39_05345 [Clostridia bacterium]|nr:hypothetical protein [Clostridia bacterium]
MIKLSLSNLLLKKSVVIDEVIMYPYTTKVAAFKGNPNIEKLLTNIINSKIVFFSMENLKIYLGSELLGSR